MFLLELIYQSVTWKCKIISPSVGVFYPQNILIAEKAFLEQSVYFLLHENFYILSYDLLFNRIKFSLVGLFSGELLIFLKTLFFFFYNIFFFILKLSTFYTYASFFFSLYSSVPFILGLSILFLIGKFLILCTFFIVFIFSFSGLEFLHNIFLYISAISMWVMQFNFNALLYLFLFIIFFFISFN
jgi:hypothetical protein